jgi:multidrug efflux pump
MRRAPCSGALIQLDDLLHVEEASEPPQLYHYNRYRSATVSSGLPPGKTIGDAINAMNSVADKVLDDSFTTSLSGASRDFAESGSNTLFALVLALVLIYLVLSAQFESFRDPFIIMLTVPLAFSGAILSLWIFNQTWNIFSQIGMIMLIGLVVKNGILIVEFANKQRERDGGMSRVDAVIEAATERLRPILMTNIATVLGALPIATGLGNGAQSRIPMGIVVVGGLMLSVLLTLYVIPAMYSYIASRKRTVAEEA